MAHSLARPADILVAYDPGTVSVGDQADLLEVRGGRRAFREMTGGADTYHEDFTSGLRDFVAARQAAGGFDDPAGGSTLVGGWFGGAGADPSALVVGLDWLAENRGGSSGSGGGDSGDSGAAEEDSGSCGSGGGDSGDSGAAEEDSGSCGGGGGGGGGDSGDSGAAEEDSGSSGDSGSGGSGSGAAIGGSRGLLSHVVSAGAGGVSAPYPPAGGASAEPRRVADLGGMMRDVAPRALGADPDED